MPICTWTSSPPSSAKWWVSTQPPYKDKVDSLDLKSSEVYLRVFLTVQHQFLAGLVLHLTTPLVAGNVPGGELRVWCTASRATKYVFIRTGVNINYSQEDRNNVARETVPSQTSDMGKKTVSILPPYMEKSSQRANMLACKTQSNLHNDHKVFFFLLNNLLF